MWQPKLEFSCGNRRLTQTSGRPNKTVGCHTRLLEQTLNPFFFTLVAIYRVSHSELDKVICLWEIEICKLELVWRLSWEAEIVAFMKMYTKSLSLKRLQKYDCFFPVHTALFYSKVWLFWQFRAISFWKKQSYPWNRLSEINLAYIFINATTSAF